MKKGIITTYVLVFGAIFLILLSGLLGFILLQLRQSSQRISWNESLEIAEAGMNYYRWCLNNGIETNCQTEKDYQDISGNNIGKFSIQDISQISCGEIIQRKIISTGQTYKLPDIKRKVSVIYARTSVAKYSYILNSNVWVGADHVVRGPYHSNGGIRFDGQNLSIVSSAQNEWVCTASFGCGPQGVGYGLGLCPSECKIVSNQCICPGVFSTTQNSNRGLFSYPVPQFDFNGITVNLAQMKTASQSSGVYLQPSVNLNPQGKGYHLKFFSDGTFEVWIITGLSPTYAYSLEEDWHYDYFTITNEYRYGEPITIDSTCPLIFFEDNLWPEGQVKGKVTVVSANLINPNLDTDIILEANIDYATQDGSSGLTLISERNVLIGPDSPNYMTLRGIFVAQKGRFSRDHYKNNIKEELDIYGSIVSSGRVGTQWVISPSGQIVSGYKKRETYIDPNLIYNPPPFTPFAEPEFRILNWEEL
ncbi:hypothetical protein GW901_00655 [Candidatus Parcubacteria bacterium]|nr:hypothetical protein [Candidatus Parcubacteria bacterium]